MLYKLFIIIIIICSYNYLLVVTFFFYKIVACIPDSVQEDNFQWLSDCSIESITRFFVDNDVRNYCILVSIFF